MVKFMDFPVEVAMEIMSLLPADSLVRLKCVCKSWYSIINDRRFVVKHLHTANNISSERSLTFISSGRGFDGPVRSFLTIWVDKDDSDHIHSATEDSLASLYQQHAVTDEYLLSSQCNGVFCLYRAFNSNVILCNPATREFKLLPDSSMRAKIDVIMLGFGYDPSVDSYKVVRAACFQNGDDLFLQAEVYTLDSNCWREINMNVMLSPHEMLDLSFAYAQNVQKQRYCKGACYWLLSPFSKKKTILSFDMSEEQFYRISLPINIDGGEKDMHTRLQTWNESVALFHFPFTEATRPIDIWVMIDSFSKSKASCCWIKHLSIGSLESICLPIAFWRIDELLMSADDGRVVSYNLHTKKLRNLPIPPEPARCGTTVYIKSLVSVHGRN